jgi:hypothetical protein
VLAVAGVGLTFGLWWMYFAVPWAEHMVRHRRGFPFGYGRHGTPPRDGRRGGSRRGRRGGLPDRRRVAPVVTVVGYETVGHRHTADALRKLRPE